MIDLDDLRNRINQIRAGTMPREAVTDDELIQAIAQLREARRQRIAARTAAKAKAAAPTITATPGSLLDRLNQIKVDD